MDMLNRMSAERLLHRPGFILTSIRSGSTLLRCILDTHSRIHAPHELHLTDLTVFPTSAYVRIALETDGLGIREVEHILWDRMLHRALVRSGKDFIVDKTPANVLAWQRVAECWQDARYIFLLRHPVRIVESAVAANPHRSEPQTMHLVLRFLDAVDEARRNLNGLTIRYEDLISKPETVTRQVCDHLGVPWEREMLDYGSVDHGPYRHGIGDFTDRIKVGRILAARAPVGDTVVSDHLEMACARWGYLVQEDPGPVTSDPAS